MYDSTRVAIDSDDEDGVGVAGLFQGHDSDPEWLDEDQVAFDNQDAYEDQMEGDDSEDEGPWSVLEAYTLRISVTFH